MKHRGTVMSKKGIVASAHSNISLAGINILRKGGNAVDAAIAMANVSGVVLPDMCGLGGDAFMLYYDSEKKEVTAINGSGGAPKNASIDYFLNKGFESMPKDGILSVSVPGAVSVYFTALEKFGTMHFSELIEDAYNLAKEGYCLTETVARHLCTDLERLQKQDSLSRMFLDKNKQPLKYGSIIKNEDYAEMLKIIGDEGPAAFYNGTITDKIIQYSDKVGGLLSHEDFNNYSCKILKPIRVEYRNKWIYQTPPVSQGIIHLEEMNILNNFDLRNLGLGTSSTIHKMVEAKKKSFYDRIKYFGDPDYQVNPIENLLTYEYGKAIAEKIDNENKASTTQEIYEEPSPNTASFIVVDKEGNAVSFIHSVAGTWGSAEMVDGTGIILNNRASQYSLDANHPNSLIAGKKTMNTLNTYLVTDKDDNLEIVGNTPGGDNQPQWNMQVLSNLMDFNLDPQEAVEFPKWTHRDSMMIDGKKVENVIMIEDRYSKETFEELANLGHTLNIVGAYGLTGASQVITISNEGVRMAGSDPRADGCALGE